VIDTQNKRLAASFFDLPLPDGTIDVTDRGVFAETYIHEKPITEHPDPGSREDFTEATAIVVDSQDVVAGRPSDTVQEFYGFPQSYPRRE